MTMGDPRWEGEEGSLWHKKEEEEEEGATGHCLVVSGRGREGDRVQHHKDISICAYYMLGGRALALPRKMCLACVMNITYCVLTVLKQWRVFLLPFVWP